MENTEEIVGKLCLIIEELPDDTFLQLIYELENRQDERLKNFIDYIKRKRGP